MTYGGIDTETMLNVVEQIKGYQTNMKNLFDRLITEMLPTLQRNYEGNAAESKAQKMRDLKARSEELTNAIIDALTNAIDKQVDTNTRTDTTLAG